MIGSAIAVTLVVVIAGVLLRGKSPENVKLYAPSDGPSAGESIAPPTVPATAEPTTTTLVLDWPEMERLGSMVRIDGVDKPVPSAGPVQFELTVGEHELVVLRRGHEAIETRITLGEEEHHYAPRWQTPATAQVDSPDTTLVMPAPPDPAPPVPPESAPASPQPKQPELATAKPEKDSKPSAEPPPDG